MGFEYVILHFSTFDTISWWNSSSATFRAPLDTFSLEVVTLSISLFISVHTSLFTFDLISFSPHFIVHVSSHFLQSTLHWSCFIFISFSPQSISFISSTIVHLLFIFTLFGCTHITWSFNLIVSFTFQPISSLEINDLRVSLDKFLILDRYSLFEAQLRWLYYSFALYVKQEIQQQLFLGNLYSKKTFCLKASIKVDQL